MEKKMALVLYYGRNNKYSFNALVGALETDSYFENLDIIFVSNINKLVSEISNIIGKYERVILGISFFTTQIWEIGELVRELKNEFKSLTCIAGGPHPTGDPIGTLKMGFDFVVKGEGEETLIDLLKTLDINEDYKYVNGISFISSTGEHINTSIRKPINLNKYPPFAVKHKKFGHIEITRGCPYVCSFCQTSHIFGTRVRHRDVREIISYVKILMENRLTDIRFITPNAFSYGSQDGKTINLKELENLLVETNNVIKDEGRLFFGTFPSEVRPEHVSGRTIDLVLKYANNDNLIIGAQSGSQKILDLCHRGHTVEDIYNAVDLTLRSGLKANVDFIFGLPNENESDVILTLKVIADLIKMGARIHAHTFMPLPQTRFEKAPAGKIDPLTMNLIESLISKGAIYGDWLKQEKVAHQIEKYIKSK